MCLHSYEKHPPNSWNITLLFSPRACHVPSRSVVSDSFATPWAVACQAPLFTGFSRQEYWSGLLFPSLRTLPEPGLPCLLRWPVDSLPLSHLGGLVALQSLKQTSELASGVEDGTTRDTGSQSMSFWSLNHMPVAMNKPRSFLEMISWLSLEGRAILHQVKKSEVEVAGRR